MQFLCWTNEMEGIGIMGKTILDYIKEQPAAFRHTLELKNELTDSFCSWYGEIKPDAVHLIASGSSYNACYAAKPFIEHVLRKNVTLDPPSAACEFYEGNPLFLYVSQGGNSTNTVAAYERLKDFPTIIMTGNEDGYLNTVTPHYVRIPCGEERVGPKTKGYLITILTLYLLFLQVGFCVEKTVSEEEYDRFHGLLVCIPDLLEENVKKSEMWVNANEYLLKNQQFYYFIGKGISEHTARECMLKLMETILTPGCVMEFEEFLHGPACSLGKGVGGIYFLPDRADPDFEKMQTLIHFHRKTSEQVFAIGEEENGDSRGIRLSRTGSEWSRVFEEVLPVQVISAVMPERMQLAQPEEKITDLLKIKMKKEY